jgi:hypothetical protein
MFNPSVTHQLVEARVEQIHRAARNDGREQVDRTVAGALANRIARSVARAFEAAHSAGDAAAGIRGFEFAGHGSITTWSRRS